MARLFGKLSAREVAKQTRPGLYGDGGGLTLQITPSGAKSWLFRFMIAGKAHGMGLGPVHAVSLADARQKAAEARKALADGRNPLSEKRQRAAQAALAEARTITFDKCAETYISAHRASWSNPKHADQWTSTIKVYAKPIIGSLPVSQIDTTLVVKILTQPTNDGEPFWQSKNETASRVRGRIESILGWATTSGFRAGDNPARWKGHLENLLPSISKAGRTKHHPSLPWRRVGAFMSALREREGIAARAVEFAILTATRSGEVRGAMWSEIDLTARTWTIPAHRMKAKREHEVPLSDAAITLLKALPRIEGCELLFPGVRNKALSDMSLTTVIRRMNTGEAAWVDKDGSTVTIHGFRSTFRMWAAESTSYPREVAEHALAHQLPDAVERAYQRGSLFAKRTLLMADWAAFCARPATTNIANVVPIRGLS
jgi:integrase